MSGATAPEPAASRPKPALLVIFVFKVPASKHQRFDDWASRFDQYKERLGIESEHYLTLPLPDGVFEGWRGLEKATGTPASEETWIVLERYASRELRTTYLDSTGAERERFFAELHSLTGPGEQIMNEYYPKGWEGYRS